MKPNLPNEHGGYVLMGVALVAGVLAAPAVAQLPALLAWIAVFFLRVPLARWLDGKRRSGEGLWAVVCAVVAAAGFAWMGLARPQALAWVVPGGLAGASLLVWRKRRFARSVAGELLSALALAFVAPSVAAAGGAANATAVTLALGFAAYFLLSVPRVRAALRAARGHGSYAAMWAWSAALPTVIVAAAALRLASPALVAGAAVTLAAGLPLYVRARRGTLSAAAVGAAETVAVAAYTAGLLSG